MPKEKSKGLYQKLYFDEDSVADLIYSFSDGELLIRKKQLLRQRKPINKRTTYKGRGQICN